MELYNKYIKLDEFKTSEIAFVNCSNTILTKFVYFVKLFNGQSGFFTDNSGELKKLTTLFLKKRASSSITVNRENFFLSNTENIILDIQPTTQHYSYIKVINDVLNPQLNDQILIFKYGNIITNIIGDYFSNLEDGELLEIKKSFILKLENKGGFPSYDNSHFTNRYYHVCDYNLDLNSEIHFNNFNLNKYIRTEKIKKINENT